MTASVEKTYAQALYEAALDAGRAEKILGELKAVSALFSENPDYQRMLGSPLISNEEKRARVDEAFSGRADDYLLNFLKVLCDNKRIGLFAPVAREYEMKYNLDNKILRVEAVTAAPLDSAMLEKLKKKLERVSGKKVVLENKPDPDVLGGVMLQIGDKQLDATIKSRMSKLRGELMGNPA